MVTIKEIARKCNVSIATVSNILNGKPNASEETRRRVLEVVKELNYTPNTVAKNLKLRKSRAIGVIAEDLTVFCAPEIIDGITGYCEEKGYHILLTNLRLYKKYQDAYYDNNGISEIVEKEIRALLSKQVDGIIYVTSHERVLNCLPEQLSVPVGMAYGYSESEKYPSVVVDDKSGAYMLIDHLIGKGHRNIGVITGKEKSIHTHDRLRGYQKALYDHNICFDPDIVAEGDWTRESGYRNTDRLLEKGVSAIFCMNDIMAGGVYDRLYEKELVPGKDISIVGFDNRELSNYYKPALTTIELPLNHIGYKTCRIIIDMIEQNEKMKNDKGEMPVQDEKEKNRGVRVEYAKCRLLVRDSVADIT